MPYRYPSNPVVLSPVKSLEQAKTKPLTLFQTLSIACDTVSVAFSLSETIRESLETFYHYSTNRISFFSYCIEWSEHIESGADHVPNKHLIRTKERLSLEGSFHNLREPDIAQIRKLNSDFSRWVSESTLRGLDEYFQFYLLNAYDLCSGINFAERNVKASEVSEGLLKEIEFEKAGLKARLDILIQEFGLKFPYKNEFLSLNSVRNIFSHHDGKVRKIDFNNNDYLEIFWLGHDVKAKKRGKNKSDPIHRHRIIDGNKFQEINTCLFSKPRKKRFLEGESILLTGSEMREICSFYLLAVNSLQEQICILAKRRDIPVRDFKEYQIMAQISAEISTD